MSTKRYDEEFKHNAVDLLLTGGQPLKVLARELGVSDKQLRKWRDDRLGKLEEQCHRPPGGSTPREMAEEIRRLRKELDRVTRQREILKKAMSILSDESPGGMR
jgi:transposase-like protein